jgi:hypothetical protein
MYRETRPEQHQIQDFEAIAMAPMTSLAGNQEVTMDLIQTMEALPDQTVDLQAARTEKGYLDSIHSRQPNHRCSFGQ